MILALSKDNNVTNEATKIGPPLYLRTESRSYRGTFLFLYDIQLSSDQRKILKVLTFKITPTIKLN